MRPRRLVFVTRQFWPLVGGAQRVMSNLAHALVERGAEVTILTARWQPSWPAELVQHQVRVVRLPQPRVRWVGTWRYMQAVRRWLQSHAGQYDLVYVSMLKHDAYAALQAVNDVPVVLRPEGTGPTGDVYWQQHARFGQVIAEACRGAEAIVTIAPHVREELLAAGYPAEKLHMIANGVEVPPLAGADAQGAARRELTQAHAPLALPDGAPLVLYAGRLDARKGLQTLLDAWPRVRASLPEARLWLVGDGPERRNLSEQIHRLELSDSVVLAGRFDAVDDFYRAADVFVLPSEEELMSMALLEAMAAGVPIVASDLPANRTLLTSGIHGQLTPVSDPSALAGALISLLTNPTQARTYAQSAHQRAAQEFSLAKMAEAHEELFESLCGRE